MTPTLMEGDIVFINRLAYLWHNPRIHDIVAVRDPRDGKIIIKRITQIEGKHYFVQGDNKQYSTDSREFGMIDRSDILGKMLK